MYMQRKEARDEPEVDEAGVELSPQALAVCPEVL